MQCTDATEHSERCYEEIFIVLFLLFSSLLLIFLTGSMWTMNLAICQL